MSPGEAAFLEAFDASAPPRETVRPPAWVVEPPKDTAVAEKDPVPAKEVAPAPKPADAPKRIRKPPQPKPKDAASRPGSPDPEMEFVDGILSDMAHEAAAAAPKVRKDAPRAENGAKAPANRSKPASLREDGGNGHPKDVQPARSVGSGAVPSLRAGAAPLHGNGAVLQDDSHLDKMRVPVPETPRAEPKKTDVAKAPRKRAAPADDEAPKAKRPRAEPVADKAPAAVEKAAEKPAKKMDVEKKPKEEVKGIRRPADAVTRIEPSVARAKKLSPDHAAALIATIVDAQRAGHGKAAGEFVRTWVRSALAKTFDAEASDAAIAAYLVLLLQFCAVVRRTATPEAAESARVLQLWLGLIAAGDDALRAAVLRVLPAANAPKKDEGKPKIAAAWMRVASATELTGDWTALVEELALYARAVQSGRVRDEGRAIDEAKLSAAVTAAAAAVSAAKPEVFGRFLHKMGSVPKELRAVAAGTIGLLVWAAEHGAVAGRDVEAAALAFGKCSDAAGRPARDARGGVETWARIAAAANRGGHMKNDTASTLLRDAIAAIAARASKPKTPKKKDATKVDAKKVDGASKKKKEVVKNGVAKKNGVVEKKKKSGTAKAVGAAKVARKTK